MASIYFTIHAVDRYKSRWRPNYSNRAALSELIIAAKDATCQKKRTACGQAIWHATTRDGDSLRLVTKNDDRRIVCVTILPQVGEIDDEDEGPVGAPVTLLQQIEAWERDRKRA